MAPATCRNHLRGLILIAAAGTLVCSGQVAAMSAKYTAGTGESVKNWPARGFEEVTGIESARLIYLYDPEPYRNNFAEKIEGKEMLNNADVKDAVKAGNFTAIKIKSDGTDVRGWPAQWRDKAKNGAAVLVWSSDNKRQIWFDRTVTPNDQFSPEGLIAALKAVQEYEGTIKKAPKDKDGKKTGKDGKETKAEALPADFKKLPGLGGDDKDKKEAKAEPKKDETKKKGPADE